MKMIYEIIPGEKVFLRRLDTGDKDIYLDFVKVNENFHKPWINQGINEIDFYNYLKRVGSERSDSLAVFYKHSEKLVGIFNISEIVKGSFRSAYLAYFGHVEYQRRGFMYEGLQLLLNYFFEKQGLHRFEANVRPENSVSINFIKKCGFVMEGFSEKYLFLDGAWRDHERWAIHKEIFNRK